MRSKFSYSSKDMGKLTIKVRLIGGLKSLAGKPEIYLTPRKRALTVSEVIWELCRKVSSTDFERAVVDPRSKTVGPNVVVLVNDKDISVLQGSETLIRGSDAVTLVPVSHGG